jgi:hypothetical protein
MGLFLRNSTKHCTIGDKNEPNGDHGEFQERSTETSAYLAIFKLTRAKLERRSRNENHEEKYLLANVTGKARS